MPCIHVMCDTRFMSIGNSSADTARQKLACSVPSYMSIVCDHYSPCMFLYQEQLQKALLKRNISCTPNKPLPDMPTEPQEQGSGHYACIAHVGCFALNQLFLSVHQTVIALCSHHHLCLDAACLTRQLQQQPHADIQAVHCCCTCCVHHSDRVHCSLTP